LTSFLFSFFLFSFSNTLQFADIFIYSALAWYFAQVWPSKVGVAKPWYFLFQKHYWFTVETFVDNEVAMPEFSPNSIDHNGSFPEEEVNEHIFGVPTVTCNKLRKTFNAQLAVNDLSFKMYQNQIFALLGHNGAGKVSNMR
jgi:ABC-type multidrug transport system fused ATPase/permease subunit